MKHNSGPTIDVKRVIPHPNYNTRTNDNDIAVLILSASFVAAQNAMTIDISRSLDPRPSSLVTVSGWGRTSVDSNQVSENLKVANLTVVGRPECSSMWAPLRISRGMICAVDNSRSACNVSSIYHNSFPLIALNYISIDKRVTQEDLSSKTEI